MDNVQRISQVYIQTPWRKQLQYAGLFLLLLILVALVAFFYINVTARSGVIGREIQLMQYQIEGLERRIVDLETEMAELTSYTEVVDRANDLGFYSVSQDEVVYLVVPGYQSRQPIKSRIELCTTFTRSIYAFSRLHTIVVRMDARTSIQPCSLL